MNRLPMRKALEERMRKLPVLPMAVTKLMELDPRDSAYFDQVLEIISAEPNCSARVLTMANSAASGSKVAITSLHLALTRVGSQKAVDSILALAVNQVFAPRSDVENDLWRHAVQVAIAARELARTARNLGVNSDEAYACGLLHDIGRLAIARMAPAALHKMGEGTWEDPGALVETERMVCGVTHAELGAIACERWGIPDSIVEVVRKHHEPPPKKELGRQALLTALVRLADLAMFSTSPGQAGWGEVSDGELQRSLLDRMAPFIELKVPDARRLLGEIEREAATLADSMGVG